MNAPLRILHLEDNSYDAELIHETLVTEGIDHQMVNVEDRSGFLAAIAQGSFDLIIADFALPSFDGQTALLIAREKCPETPFIFVSGAIGEERAIESLKLGATDYVLKHRLSRLAPAIQRALREVAGEQQRQQSAASLVIRAQQQAAVAELGQLALANTDLSLLMNETVLLVAQALNVPFSLLWQRQDEGQTLRLVAGKGWHEGWVGYATLKTDSHSHAGYTLLSQEPVILTDLTTETRFTISPIAQEHQLVSGMSVVVTGEEQPFGVLAAYTNYKRTFTGDDLHFLQSIAHILTTAIERKQREEQLRQSRNQLRAILEGITEGITVQRPDGSLIYANEMAAQLAGFPSVSDFMKSPIAEITQQLELRDEAGRPFPVSRLPGRLALEGKSANDTLIRFRLRGGGEERWSIVSATPIFDEQGQVQFAVNIFRDVTERTRLYEAEKEARQRAEAAAIRIASLQMVTASLTEALTPLQVAQIVEEQTMAVVGAQAAATVLLREADSGPLLEVMHSLGYGTRQVAPPRQFALDAPFPIAEAVRSGQPQFISSRALAQTRFPIFATRAAPEFNAWAIFPLLIQGRIIGGMVLSFHQEREFDTEDQAFLFSLARQCAQALERARLYEAEQQARHLAEDTAERITGLQRVTSALSQALTPNQVAHLVIQEGITILGATAGSVVAANEKEEMLEVLYASGYEPEVMGRWGRFPLLTDVPIAQVVRNGQAIFLSSIEEAIKQFPLMEQDVKLTGNHAWAAIPLLIEGRTIGALGLSFAQPHAFGPDDETFMMALGRQCAQALERARLYEAERMARAEATRLNEVLEQRVAERTEQLRWLTHQVVTAQEAERHRISRELHDEAGQALTALRINLGLIREDLPDDLASLKQRMAEAVLLTGDAMEQIRNLAHDLRPPSLDTVGLNLTLEGFCREFAQRTQLVIHYQGADLPEMPEPVSTTFYRLLQEALTNVARHAQAHEVRVILDYADHQLSLMVTDDGQGFAEEVATDGQNKGLGLLGMQERLELLNGWLEIDSHRGQGTRLTAYVSLR